MPINLEIKAYLSDPKNALLLADKLNFTSKEIQQQKDTYFRVGKGRLKLREILGRESELIYYDREEEEDIRKSYYSVYKFPREKNLGPILEQALGKIITVRKRRHIYIYQGARIHIDEVLRLGWFIEFEVPAETDKDLGEQLMIKLFKIFDIRNEDLERASYMDLLLGKERDIHMNVIPRN